MKYKFVTLPFVLLLFSSAFSQELRLLTKLDNDLEESSGLIYLEGKLITHNDSGDEARLFEIDTLTGEVARTVNIENASHVDWEDICYDEDYIYIGDFGNNYGTRRDLKIYKIAINEYSNNYSIEAETIKFSYADQTSFLSNQFTNYDAEALISYGDSLYIFTKNRGNLKCNIYAIPKNPGEYESQLKESFEARGLITGASFHPSYNKIMLCGYYPTAFYYELSDFTGSSFVNGNQFRTPLFPEVGYSSQIEAITFINQHSFFLSGEETETDKEALYILNINPASPLIDQIIRPYEIYPNPVSQTLNVITSEAFIIKVYNSLGVQILESTENSIDLSAFPKSIYTIVFWAMRTQESFTEKIVLK